MHIHIYIIRLNTFGAKILISGSEKDGTAQYHFPHEHTDTLKNIYLTDFVHSDECDQLLKKH